MLVDAHTMACALGLYRGIASAMLCHVQASRSYASILAIRLNTHCSSFPLSLSPLTEAQSSQAADLAAASTRLSEAVAALRSRLGDAAGREGQLTARARAARVAQEQQEALAALVEGVPKPGGGKALCCCGCFALCRRL